MHTALHNEPLEAGQQNQNGRDLKAAPRTDATLGECVTRVVRDYFTDMGDHDPEDLMARIMNETEAALLAEVMQQCHGKQTQAAEILGINRGTLRKKLKLHDLL